MLRRFFSSARAPARGKTGWRAYVVGDVHGRLDLLDDLLVRIAADHGGRPPAHGLLAFVGDLIDRGPDSAGVIERIRTLKLTGFRIVALAGNHEEVLLQILAGDHRQVTGWLRFGGAEALASYGVDADALAALAPKEAQAEIARGIPGEHRAFLEQLGDTLRFGDYLIVHAGIRPGVPLEQQVLADLRWIREPFLSDTRDHGATIVHGHTIADRVEAVGSRIGIDTGAYATGRLTALAIEGDRKWLIDTVDGMHEGDLNRV
ncbi:metallophosphoesterase [Sphingomonas sp. LHG3406-1]|uniref:metallophosphoesterase n=1 Tax=Sphingomonas sp. LHG3406-1 TaxID=2804617 RepID=UPI002615CE62|nr:metallophosphoesterase [Sphingomonas sp. LHG3406-1]